MIASSGNRAPFGVLAAQLKAFRRGFLRFPFPPGLERSTASTSLLARYEAYRVRIPLPLNSDDRF